MTDLVTEEDEFGTRLVLTIDVTQSWVGTDEQLILTHDSPDLYDLGELAVGDQLLVMVHEDSYYQALRILSLWHLDETGKYLSSYHVYPRHCAEPNQLYDLITGYLDQG